MKNKNHDYWDDPEISFMVDGYGVLFDLAKP